LPEQHALTLHPGLRFLLVDTQHKGVPHT
jgi:hypothetical protein